MDKLNFNHPGGFPLETQTLDKMQEAWSLLGSFAKGFGENVILSGCESPRTRTTSSTLYQVTPGIMVINGEVVPFKGGEFNSERRTNVKIEETSETITLKDGSNVEFYKKRTAVPCGIGEGVLWSTFERLSTVKDITTRLETIEHDTDWHECVSGNQMLTSKIQCRQKSGVVYITGTVSFNIKPHPSFYSVVLFKLPRNIQPPSVDLFFIGDYISEDSDNYISKNSSTVLKIEKKSRNVTVYGIESDIIINYSYPI